MNLKAEDFASSCNESHNVCYYLYPDDIKDVDKFGIPNNITKRDDHYIIKHGSTICFAGLLGELKRNKGKINRLVYILAPKSSELTKDETVKWLNMCIKAKALPNYIKKESDVAGNRYVLKIDPSLRLSVMFIYLTCIRWLQEAPIFVRNMLKLVGKYNMNFYISWLVASRMSMGNTWHNIVIYGSEYGQSINGVLTKCELDIAIACGIRNLLAAPKEFDKYVVGRIGNGFNATGNITTAKPNLGLNSTVHMRNIANEELNKAMSSKTNKNLENVLNKLCTAKRKKK